MAQISLEVFTNFPLGSLRLPIISDFFVWWPIVSTAWDELNCKYINYLWMIMQWVVIFYAKLTIFSPEVKNFTVKNTLQKITQRFHHRETECVLTFPKAGLVLLMLRNAMVWMWIASWRLQRQVARGWNGVSCWWRHDGFVAGVIKSNIATRKVAESLNCERCPALIDKLFVSLSSGWWNMRYKWSNNQTK